MTLYAINTTIVTADGSYELQTLTTEEAIALSQSEEITSCVGHESTAEIMTEILGTPIEANRIGFFPEAGDRALCFKLNSRPKEGAILTRKELEEIGFSFKLLTRTR